MIKKVFLLITIISFLFVIPNVSADVEYSNIRSQVAASATSPGGNNPWLTRDGGNNYNSTLGVRFSIIDKTGKRISKTYDIFFKDSSDTGKVYFYNSKYENKYAVMEAYTDDDPTYKWGNYTTADSDNIKKREKNDIVSLDFSTLSKLPEYSSLVKSLSVGSNDDPFPKVEAYLRSISNAINLEYKNNNGEYTITIQIFNKFGLSNNQQTECLKNGCYLIAEPITQYQIGNEYYITPELQNFYDLIAPIKKYFSQSNPSAYNILGAITDAKSTNPTLYNDFYDTIKGNDMATFCGSLTYEVDMACKNKTNITPRYTSQEFLNACNTNLKDAAFSSRIIECNYHQGKYSELYEKAVLKYYNILRDKYYELEDKYKIDQKGKSTNKGKTGTFYFVGTPSEAYKFNNSWDESGSDTRTRLINYCKNKEELYKCPTSNSTDECCNDYINSLNSMDDFLGYSNSGFARLQMDKKITEYIKNPDTGKREEVSLKYKACGGSSNYFKSNYGCGISAVSVIAEPPEDEKYENCDKLYDILDNLTSKEDKKEIDKILKSKYTFTINGEDVEKELKEYCCDTVRNYSDAFQNDSTKMSKLTGPNGAIYKICNPPSKTCTYDDFIAITKLDDWGSGEEPSNGIKTTLNPSKFVSERTEDALWKDKLYACCSFENYDTDARKKIKEEYFVKKKIIGPNDKLKKPFNDLLKPKCKPSNVSDACNYTDYLVLKDIAEGSGKYSKSTLVHYNNEDTVYYACCKNVTSIGTNKEVIINQNKLKEVWDLTHYNPNGSAITTAQTTDLENVVRMACPAQDDKNPKCDYHETIEEGIRWGGKDGKIDCCIYDNVDPASLPSTLSTESKFKADINSRAETYDELKACISGQYCTLNNKREFVLPQSAKLQGKDESWCCYNNEGQWQDDEYYRNTILNDLEIKNKYHCTVNYCDWDKLMKGEKVQNGTDCCKLSGFEQNNTLYKNIRTKLSADKKTVNGKLIKTNTKLTYIESNIDDAFFEAVKEVCPTSNDSFCTYEMINSKDHPCCDNYDRYSDDDKSQINNFSGTKVQKLHQWLAAKDKSTGQNRYQDNCTGPDPCSPNTIVACPNCSKIISGTRNVETSYDTIKAQDSTIRNTSEDIKDCIVSEEKFNSTINESIGNDYCPVYCTEKIIYDYPKGLESVEAGRQYYLAPAYITTVKTCRINHINTELFLARINSYYDQILAAYEEYKKYDTAIADANFSGSSYTYTSNSFIKKIEYDADDDTNKCDCINNTDHIKCCKSETSNTFTTTPTTSSSGNTYVGSKEGSTSSKAADCKDGTFTVTCEWNGGSIDLTDDCGNDGCDKICQNYKKENNISDDVTGTGGTCTKDVSYYCPSSSSTVIDGVTYSGTLVKDSSDTEKCTYLYYKCSNIDLTKYDYEVVNKYSYSNGVDSSKTNEQTTHACITNATGANLYSTQYNSSKTQAWNKVNALYGQYLNEIQKLKDCFNIPEVIKNSEDYNFDIEASYMQADYEHTDQMLKELVSVNDSDQDQEVINRKTLTFKQNQTKKITIDTSRKLTVGTLEIENAYSGDLSKKIYSVKVERQYKYTLTTGYNYTLKGTPLSVKEKEKELQEVAIATHLPVSYENTENGTVTLKTSLSNLNSKEARSDLALCTVEENEDNAYVCDFSVYDRLILSPGILPVYRPIKLGNPFPDADGNGRNTGVNWCQDSTNCSNNPNINNVVKTYITNNRDVEEENVYRMTPLYTIKLSPMDIQNIRNYNKTTNYNDFRLVCDPNTGLNCQSIFLRGSHSTGWNADEEPYSTPSGVINNIYNLIVKDKSCAFFNGSGMNCRLDGKDLFAGGIN